MNSQWTTSACTPQDRQRLIALLSHARWKHKHVDWIDTLDLLGQQPFLLAFQDNKPIGSLACPPDPPGTSWLRLFAVAPGYSASDIWKLLWPQAASEAIEAGATRSAVLLMGGWLAPFLRQSGFEQTNSVVFLEWGGGMIPARPSPPGTMRAFRSADLRQVVKLDHMAFEPIWRFSGSGLLEAFTHASLSTVTEYQGEITGYQIVSSSALGTHIARLAVAPKWQGQGFGSVLVRLAMKHANDMGSPQLTVNTQSDNQQSQNLYRALSFTETGQTYPVWEKQLSPT